VPRTKREYEYLLPGFGIGLRQDRGVVFHPIGLNIPAAPTGLAVQSVSATQLGVSWGAVPSATRYRIERSPNGVNGWQLLAVTPDLSHQDLGLSAVTTYYYRVQASNRVGIGPYSDVASGATGFDWSAFAANTWLPTFAAGVGVTLLGAAPTDGGNIDAWADQSPFALVPTLQGAVGQVTWIANALNGMPAVAFAGAGATANVLATVENSLLGLQNLTGYTEHLVVQANNPVTNQVVTSYRGSPRIWDQFASNLFIAYASHDAGATNRGRAAYASNTPHIITTIFDGSQADADTPAQNAKRLRIWVDNVQIALGFDAGDIPADLGNAAGSQFLVALGGLVTGSNLFAGRLFEKRMFAAVHSDDQRTAAYNFLKATYGL
jgi:hypothetical protein